MYETYGKRHVHAVLKPTQSTTKNRSIVLTSIPNIIGELRYMGPPVSTHFVFAHSTSKGTPYVT